MELRTAASVGGNVPKFEKETAPRGGFSLSTPADVNQKASPVIMIIELRTTFIGGIEYG
jgi:hypothetical protein